MTSIGIRLGNLNARSNKHSILPYLLYSEMCLSTEVLAVLNCKRMLEIITKFIFLHTCPLSCRDGTTVEFTRSVSRRRTILASSNDFLKTNIHIESPS